MVTIDSQSGFTTKDYRDAISGEGPLAYAWSDKPHRLLRDLIKFIEFNADNVKPLAGEIEHLTAKEMNAIMDQIEKDHEDMGVGCEFCGWNGEEDGEHSR